MQYKHSLLAIGIALLWGVNFVAAKASVSHFSPFFFLGGRLVLVLLLLSPFLRYRPQSFRPFIYISFTLMLLHFGLMFLSLHMGMTVSVAVVVDQLRVPCALVLGYLLFNERMGRRGVFGIVVAVIGTFVLMGTPSVLGNVEAFWVLLASVGSWAFYNVQLKRAEPLPVFSFLAWISLFGAPQLLLISYLFEQNQWEQVMTAGAVVWWSAAYVTFIATIFAHGCWYYLVKQYDISVVVPYSLLSPFFGMIAGILLLHEVVTWENITGGLLTIAGVAMVVLPKLPFEKRVNT